MESFYFYDLGHWRHIITKDGYDVGETIINSDNRGLPVIKRGAAPCEFLDLYYTWFTVDEARNDLMIRGFKQVNETLWIKEN